MRHSAQSIFVDESNKISTWVRIYIQNHLMNQGTQQYR
jgi:hypothetical protein